MDKAKLSILATRVDPLAESFRRHQASLASPNTLDDPAEFREKAKAKLPGWLKSATYIDFYQVYLESKHYE